MAQSISVKAKLPSLYGDFEIYVFPEERKDHVALVMGDIAGRDVLCRVHSECITSEVFGSMRCDCREQLEAGLRRIAKEGRGVLIYLRQEGRGIGLFKKIRAYQFQDQGMDTVEANQAIGEEIDDRDFSIASRMLNRLGVKSVRLMTNNPHKIKVLEKGGIKVESALPLSFRPNWHNAKYIHTKKTKLGHAIL